MREIFAASLTLVVSFLASPCAGCAAGGHSGAGTALDGGDDSDDLADGAPPLGFGEGGPACKGSSACSPDLHQVLCNGTVVQTCNADQGCAAGKCVDACAAAAANQSTIGCDYYAFDPDTILPGECFAAFVSNTWGSPVTIQVDFGGQPLANFTDFARLPSGSGQSIAYAPLAGNTIGPGDVAILFLASYEPANAACPAGVTPAYTSADAATHGTGIGKAFHITTDRPVVANAIYPYGGGQSVITSATLLVPTSGWDTNYIAADGYGGVGAPWVSIVAQADGTNVTISPTAAIAGGNGVQGTGAGQPHTYTIGQGDVLQLVQADGTELNGSPIQSDKPVAVFGGATCMNVPVGRASCDSGMQQLLPVRAMGDEYVYARYRDRYEGVVESPPVRVIGAVDGTVLTYDPAPPSGAPTALASRQTVEFSASSPFTVRSQDDKHPFAMAAYMTGASVVEQNNPNDRRGDPEFVNVVPSLEYLTSYVFFTDPTYPETELVIVRRQNADGAFDDVSLDCLGPAIGGWQPVGSAGKYESTRVELVTGNFQKVGSCDNGRHEMKSRSPFGVTVWGWGSGATGGAYENPNVPGFFSQAVSYAYPAGMAVTPITTITVPPTPR